MIKKTIFIGICAFIVAVLTVCAAMQAIKIYNRKNDPYWQMAVEIHRLQQALKKEDEEWNLDSLNSVTPYCYTIKDGNVIMYYHCRTTYLGEVPTKLEGVNTAALLQVVDVDSLENKENCTINGFSAVTGDFNGKRYLCWTLNPQDSCVIEYTPETVSEDDIFHMAESVRNTCFLP